MNRRAVLVVAGIIAAVAAAQESPLARRYKEGETLHYVMNGDNRGRHYRADATAVVKRDDSGHFVEEYTWSNLVVDGNAVTLPPASAAVRQSVSLDPAFAPRMPNLASLDSNLVGPTLDLLNFYADLWLATKQPSLTTQGSHALVLHGKPNSWADGKRVLVGEDAIDFDITLTSLDLRRRIAVVTVRHVPPEQSRVKLPASWMKAPVADTPNNWVQVVKGPAGGYVASIGKETFEVRIEASLDDGRIISATMDNPVNVLERECSDATLEVCREPRRYEIRRRIDLR